MPSAPRTALRAVPERRRTAQNSTGLALLVVCGIFVAIGLVPSLKYPVNPPTVEMEDTAGERSSAFLGITVISVAACVAVAAGLALSRGGGGGRPLALPPAATSR
jgi:Probable cobalt transporter subunit (CbtA)